MNSKTLEEIALELIEILTEKNYHKQGYLKFCIWSKLFKFYYPSIPNKYYIRKIFDIVLNKKYLLKSEKVNYNYKFKNINENKDDKTLNNIILYFD